jgi:hypothetical protein
MNKAVRSSSFCTIWDGSDFGVGQRSASKCSGMTTYPIILKSNSCRNSPKLATQWSLKRTESYTRARR